MFEKEAEKYAQDMAMYYESTHGSVPSQFEKYLRKAVEYGYNKANEEYEARMKVLTQNRDELLAEIERLEERVGELEECY